MPDRREEALEHREIAAAQRKLGLVTFAEAHERQADALEPAEPLDVKSVRAMEDAR